MKAKAIIFVFASIIAIPVILLTGSYAYLPLHILITVLAISVGFMSAGKLNIFTPLSFTSIYIILIFYLGYFFYNTRVFVAEEYLSIGIIEQSQLIKANNIALLSAVAWLAGYLFRHVPPKVTKRRSSVDGLNFSPVIVSLLYITFFLLYCASIGGIPLFIDNYHGEARTELGKGLGLIYSVIFACQIFYLMWLAKILIKFNRFDFSIANLILASMPIFVLTLLNERGALVGYVLSVLIIYNQIIGVISFRRLAILFLALVVLAGSFGAIRSGSGVNGLLANAAVNVLLEAGVEYDNYNEVVRAVPEELPYQNGSTVLATLTILVPRAILPNKDEIFKPAGVLFKEYMNHEHIRVGERITLPGELLLNFGVIGLVLLMGLYGFVGRYLHHFFSQRIASPFYQGLYPIILISYSGLIVGDIASTAVGLISNVVFGSVLFVFIVIFQRVLSYSTASTLK